MCVVEWKGFRLVEKYALLVGGCSTHRYDLSSMVMLKGTMCGSSREFRELVDMYGTDNHIWSTGSITEAVKAAKRVGGFSTKIEVETRTLEEAREAVCASVVWFARVIVD
jgi:nicotinate-nucleotide pyrophosphorylase (carboxylating)